ncbi:MAG: hypothetical protein NZ899_10105 [Thermoguttaceae bacterium]|nr:hypothetical protein [Thermoguttaceae bacterium]MDW8078038.1 hypothetical protein [Thermoguttaceae bacterium]
MKIRPAGGIALWMQGFVVILTGGMSVFSLGQEATTPATKPAPLPPEWLAAWQEPPLADLPLQIVHAIPPARARGHVLPRIKGVPWTELQTDEGMAYYLRRGIGGLVCNVAFRDYLRSEEAWQVLTQAVDICAQLGMPIWIYDEEGYPSGAAGGLVLQQYPEGEALALVWDPDDPRQYFVRRAFEHTHAANNYFAVRRYINIIDEQATRTFVALTHDAYYKRLSKHFGKTIVAFFTDEPSLIAVNLGPIPEPAQSRVPVRDKPDPAIKPLPSIPWGHDLADCYRKRYGEDITQVRQSLFQGDNPVDRQVRRQFWSLISELVAERYFRVLRDWCREHGVASSGHNLAEESLLLHVPLYGNALKAIALMDIPGLDMLSSDPGVVTSIGWMTAALPLSGALLEGNRRVMTEVSDFSQKMFGPGPVNLGAMQATAAWQAAWGVTEFTLYYSPEDRSVDDNRLYGLFVGRLNALLKSALPVPKVALYYPIYDLWAEYIPSADRPTDQSQSERFRRISESFYRIGRSLQQRQIPFVLIDHEYLGRARVENGQLRIGNLNLTHLVLPMDVELPPETERAASQLATTGGKVIRDGSPERITPATVHRLVSAPVVVEPPNEHLTLGHFLRDGREILLLVNVGKSKWTGAISPAGEQPWWLLDPHSGQVKELTPSEGRVPVELEAYRTVILVH